MEVTQGTLLGGRLRYAQPLSGYRTGIEPVLLAACVPARHGDGVLEAGIGAGAGLMCLAARVGGLSGSGVEFDPAVAELARANLKANALTGFDVVVGDVTRLELPCVAHAMANPPWFNRRSTGSPSAGRRLAKQEGESGIEAWIAAMTPAVSGSVTMVMAAEMAARALSAFASAGFGRVTRLSLLPKDGRAAKLAIVQAWRGPGHPPIEEVLVLHEEDGRYRPAIEAVLRDGAALPLSQGGENNRLPLP